MVAAPIVDAWFGAWLRGLASAPRAAAMTGLGAIGALFHNRNGTASVEFAVIGSIFLALLLFTLYLGFRLYAQVALDYATGRAARLLSVDSTQSRSRDGCRQRWPRRRA